MTNKKRRPCFFADLLYECSGVDRNFNGGPRLLYLSSHVPFCLSLFSPFTPPFPSLSSPLFLPLPLEVEHPKIQQWGLRERCELPQPGLGQSRSRN